MQRGLERSALDAQDFVGARADGLPDAVSMLGTPLQRAQDHHVEGSLNEVEAFLFEFVGRHGR